MSEKDICRTCLGSSATMCPLFESIAPKFDSPPNAIIELWKTFKRMLISYDDGFPDKICIKCLDEIQRTYTFMLKCERSENILKRMNGVRFKQLNEIPIKCEYEIEEIVDFDNDEYPNTSQRKIGTIECYQAINELEKGDMHRRDQFKVMLEAKIDGLHDKTSEDLLNVEYKDEVVQDVKLEQDDFPIEILDDMECVNSVAKGNVAVIQNIKQEPELNIDDENVSENKFSTEVMDCPGCCYARVMLESREKRIINGHMKGKNCKLCNKDFDGSPIQHCSEHLLENCECDKSKHMQHNSIRQSFTCSICSKPFKYETSFNNHMLQMHAVQTTTNKNEYKCKVCSKVFKQKCRLNSHVRVHTGERPFRCERCPKDFRERNNLMSHMLVVHAVESTNISHVKCSICSKMFGRKCDLRVHMRIHTGERPFACKICSKNFRYTTSLNSHMTLNHADKSVKHQCKVCWKIFSLKASLTMHMKKHSAEQVRNLNLKTVMNHIVESTNEENGYSCEVCPQKFRLKSRLKKHLRVHTGERPFKCETCSKDFLNKHNLLNHLRCHTGEWPFKCEICAKTFRYKSILTNHIRRHTGERPFQCEICRKTFKYNTGLATHMQVAHTVETSAKNLHKCDTCSKVFKRKYVLLVHMRSHTGEKPYACEVCAKEFRYKTSINSHMAMNHSDESENKSHKCEICSKIFGRKHALLVHMRIHTDEMPFTCKVCSKKYRYKYYLRAHMAQHHTIEATDERHYKCGKCSRVFVQKSRFDIHLRTHTKEKPFKCETCSKGFRYIYALRNHMRVVHNIESSTSNS